MSTKNPQSKSYSKNNLEQSFRNSTRKLLRHMNFYPICTLKFLIQFYKKNLIKKRFKLNKFIKLLIDRNVKIYEKYKSEIKKEITQVEAIENPRKKKIEQVVKIENPKKRKLSPHFAFTGHGITIKYD